MSRFLLVLAAVLLTLGCQPKPKAAAAPAYTGPAPVDVLTNQTVVYECPQCGMDFDGPGQCTMDHIDLVKTGIAYICPADNKPVEHSGKCPRCAANATVRRTALAPDIPPALKGN
jgi:predicted RNA-binding Zn-ribbon protein involved in translation (DUF1610 family)